MSQGTLFLRGIVRLDPCRVRCTDELPQNPCALCAPAH